MIDETPQAALAAANRILAHENVLDAFGHVSMRHPEKPDHFYLSRSLAPELVKDDDIVEATIPFTVVRGFDEQAFQISIEFWVGIAIGMVLIMVGFVPFAYKLGLSHGRRKI